MERKASSSQETAALLLHGELLDLPLSTCKPVCATLARQRRHRSHAPKLAPAPAPAHMWPWPDCVWGASTDVARRRYYGRADFSVGPRVVSRLGEIQETHLLFPAMFPWKHLQLAHRLFRRLGPCSPNHASSFRFALALNASDASQCCCAILDASHKHALLFARSPLCPPSHALRGQPCHPPIFSPLEASSGETGGPAGLAGVLALACITNGLIDHDRNGDLPPFNISHCCPPMLSC